MKTKLHPTQILILSFAITIFLGTGLLMLPYSTVETPLNFIDALFMATSATCVTGLTVIDVGSKLTFFGQIIILTLFQLGGLGIMTFSTIIIFFTGKNLPLKEKAILRDSFIQFSAKELLSIIKFVFVITFTIEGIGSLLLFIRWGKEFEVNKGMFYSVFHSISAFCNAGFSLFPNSLNNYKADPLIILTMTFLILLGGLGFFVLVELKNVIFKSSKVKILNRISLHTKIVLSSSGILIAIGVISFYFLEEKNSLKDLPLVTKLLCSLFQSITIRTAGFSSMDFGSFTAAFLFLTIILMFIGASPGSTGGGIKTTSVGILFAMVKAKFTAREDVSIFKRTINSETLGKSISVIFASVFFTILFSIALSISELGYSPIGESNGKFIEILFEAISAFGTVGLSTGYTPKLTSTGRILITIMMFIGRLGPLTITVALSRRRSKGVFQYSEESIMVG